MGQKALQKTFATSHGKKSFAQIVIFRQFDEFFNNSAKKLMIFNQFDGKTAIKSDFSLISRENACKAFCPMGKKPLQVSIFVEVI